MGGEVTRVRAPTRALHLYILPPSHLPNLPVHLQSNQAVKVGAWTSWVWQTRRAWVSRKRTIGLGCQQGQHLLRWAHPALRRLQLFFLQACSRLPLRSSTFQQFSSPTRHTHRQHITFQQPGRKTRFFNLQKRCTCHLRRLQLPTTTGAR